MYSTYTNVEKFTPNSSSSARSFERNFTLARQPRGGYGLVVFNDNIFKNITNINNIDNIIGTNINNQGILIEDYNKINFLNKLYSRKDLCFKFFFDNNSFIKERDSILNVVNYFKEEKEELKNNTSIEEFESYYSFVIYFNKDIEVVKNSYVDYISFTICKKLKNLNEYKTNNIDNIKEKLIKFKNFLYLINIKGIYHTDIKKENIMIDDDDNFRFIDFGSCFINNEYEEDMKISNYYISKQKPNPVINYYFFDRDYKKLDISTFDDLSKLLFKNDKGPGLLYTQFEFIKNKINSGENDYFFERYLFHKRDQYDLFKFIYYFLKPYITQISGGGFLSIPKCFGKRSSVSIIANNEDYTLELNKNNILKNYKEFLDLLYIDQTDYLSYRTNYFNNKKCSLNLIGGKKIIKIKFNNRSYTIYYDKNKNKYIKQKNIKIYLKDIKGKYRYIRQ